MRTQEIHWHEKGGFWMLHSDQCLGGPRATSYDQIVKGVWVEGQKYLSIYYIRYGRLIWGWDLTRIKTRLKGVLSSVLQRANLVWEDFELSNCCPPIRFSNPSLQYLNIQSFKIWNFPKAKSDILKGRILGILKKKRVFDALHIATSTSL